MMNTNINRITSIIVQSLRKINRVETSQDAQLALAAMIYQAVIKVLCITFTVKINLLSLFSFNNHLWDLLLR